MKESLGLTLEIIEGSGGVYEVVVDGNLEYSKAATGVFPNEDQLLDQLVKKYGSK